MTEITYHEEIYHRGHLVFDCNVKTERGRNIMAKRDEAWKLYEAGLVSLVQRRIGPLGSEIFEYIMQHKKRKH
ncbi:MAG: hypothetical protein GY943_30490 [Chloroflexi bacterium]|nr:hypothetical protein [Chloroflexota bacterium]